VRRAGGRGPATAARAAAALAVVALGLLLTPARADAHAELLSTQPTAGEQLATPPSQVVLQFSEAVDISDDSVRVLDATGEAVTDRAPEHPQGQRSQVVLALPDLDDGAYVVTWKAVSSDSHPVSGAFTFRVGTAAGAAADDKALIADVLGGSGTAGGDHVLGGIYGAARFAAFAGLVVVVGSLMFVTWLWPAGLADRRARRLLAGGLVTAAVATVLCIPLQGAYATGGSLGDAFDPGIVGDELGVRTGRAWLLRLVLLGVVAVLVRLRRLDRRAAVGLGLALLVTVSVTGHASSGDWVPLAFAVDLVHLGGVSVWLGGLAVLAAAVLWQDAEGDIEAIVARFSQVAFVAVVLIVASGTIQGIRQVGSYDALFDTDYGRLLVIKVLLVGAMLCAAAFSRAWVRERAAARDHALTLSPGPGAVAASPGPGAARLSLLRRSVAVEVGIGVCVLAVAALLVNAVPGSSSSTPGGPFSTEVHGETVALTVDVTPARAGANDIRLQVTDHGGTPLVPEEVTGSLQLPDKQLGPIDLTLTDAGNGRYRADGTDIPFAGNWDLDVTVRTSDIDQDQLEVVVPVS
jgi:copper transport protein